MNKIQLIAVVAGVSALSSCTTSADPHTGGLFFSKAKYQRDILNPLKAQDAASQARLDAAQSKRQALLKKQAALRAKVNAARARGASPSSVASLESQINQYQRQIDALSSF